MRPHLKLPHAVQEGEAGEEAVRTQEEEVEGIVATKEDMDTVDMVGGGEGEGQEVTADEVATNLNPISKFALHL